MGKISKANTTFLRTPAEQLEREREIYMAGNIDGLKGAFKYCREYGHAYPEWVLNGIENELQARKDNPLTIGKGPAGKEDTRVRRNQLKFLRYLAVCEEKEKIVDGKPTTWDQAYERAGKSKVGGIVVSGDTMKKAYLEVSAALNNEELRGKYLKALLILDK